MNMKIIALLLLSLTIVSSLESTWVDLFKFPYVNTPLQIMMGISCPTVDQCWLAGGQTNTGFGIYKTSDKDFTNVTKIEIDAKEPPIMLLSIGMQDSKHGVCGGIGLGLGGIYYTDDGETFHAAPEIGLFQTQAVYSLGEDQYAFVGDVNNKEGTGSSTNGGKSFTGHFWPKNFSTDAPARYGSFPSKNVWYVTGGQWPQSPSDNPDPEIIEITSRLHFNKRTQKHEFSDFTQSSDDNSSNYTAMIAKTEDGGETWTKVFSDEGKFYFNGIDCYSEDICMAVGEGFVRDGGEGGARVFKTTDGGKNWTNIYTYGADKGGSGLDIHMLSENEVWVGTTFQETQFKCGAEFSHSVDGGKTWTLEPILHNIGAVTQMSFIDENNAYAAAITSVQLSTALAFRPKTLELETQDQTETVRNLLIDN